MELRVLNYFLAVCREGSITKASEALHLSQPTLSRQLKELEDELGKPLMIRGSRTITLTDEGMLLRKRASEMLELAERTKDEIAYSDDSISGDIYINAGETQLLHYLTKAMADFRQDYPEVRFHIASGDTQDVYDDLNKGLADFAVTYYLDDSNKYNNLELPGYDTWGIYMKSDDPLAQKTFLKRKDLNHMPLIIPRRSFNSEANSTYLNEIKKTPENMIVGTYSLMFNATLMVKDGVGYALGLKGLADTSPGSGLTFVELENSEKSVVYLIWKKYIVMSKAAKAYLDFLQAEK